MPFAYILFHQKSADIFFALSSLSEDGFKVGIHEQCSTNGRRVRVSPYICLYSIVHESTFIALEHQVPVIVPFQIHCTDFDRSFFFVFMAFNTTQALETTILTDTTLAYASLGK